MFNAPYKNELIIIILLLLKMAAKKEWFPVKVDKGVYIHIDTYVHDTSVYKHKTTKYLTRKTGENHNLFIFTAPRIENKNHKISLWRF